jgi:hypothetical protein
VTKQLQYKKVLVKKYQCLVVVVVMAGQGALAALWGAVSGW